MLAVLDVLIYPVGKLTRRSCKFYCNLYNQPAILKLTTYFILLLRLEIKNCLFAFLLKAVMVWCVWVQGLYLHLSQNQVTLVWTCDIIVCIIRNCDSSWLSLHSWNNDNNNLLLMTTLFNRWCSHYILFSIEYDMEGWSFLVNWKGLGRTQS
jgi:hypothetical protein